ncbi:hypothetical protein PFISCL1PPCAC_16729, partial [Pristionchus fissidentatus]
GSWRVVADAPVSFRCDEDLALIFTSVLPDLIPVDDEKAYSLSDSSAVFVSPRGGMMMGVASCDGVGDVTLFTGAGSGVAEYRFPLKTWRCTDVPRWIVSFDNVVTLATDPGMRINLTVHDKFENGKEVELRPSEGAAVLTSGRSDNVQNLGNHGNDAHFRL